MSGLRARSVSVLLTIAALWFTVASLRTVSYVEGLRRTADTFAADQADVLHTTATVASLDFTKRKIGGSTSAEVTWDGGKGSDYIGLSGSEDVRSRAPVGHHLPVAVWRGHVMRFELGDEWHKTDEYPSIALGYGRLLICLFTVGAAVCGRMSAHRWLVDHVDRKRFISGDLLVLPFVVTTVVIAFTSHLTLLTYLVPATIAALVLSAVALPALPWMRAPSRHRATTQPEPEPDLGA